MHLIAESVDEGNGGVVRDHLQTLSGSVVSAYSMSQDATADKAFARPTRMRGKGRSVQERVAAGWRRQDADEVDGVGHDESLRNESGSVQTSMQSALTDPRRIVAAEMYRINNRRYIAVADARGKIAVVDVESRKIHSVFLAPDGVVAFRQSPHYVAWVGATAAGCLALALCCCECAGFFARLGEVGLAALGFVAARALGSTLSCAGCDTPPEMHSSVPFISLALAWSPLYRVLFVLTSSRTSMPSMRAIWRGVSSSLAE